MLDVAEKGDIWHCFIAENTINNQNGNTRGCASGRTGTTELGHDHSLEIAVHEIGHQLGAEHEVAECYCKMRVTEIDFETWPWSIVKKCVVEVRTIMCGSVTDRTEMRMSEKNKLKLLREAEHNSRGEHDVMTWNHCANEGQTCHCDGTVRYGANGPGPLCGTGSAYHDGPMVNGDAGAMSPQECQRKCAADHRCNFWDFDNYVCRLRSSSGTGPKSHDWAAFGEKHCKFGRWSSPRPVRGQISCSNGMFTDVYPGVVKTCQCTSSEWEKVGAGGCRDIHEELYRRQVLVTGQYGFSGTVHSCKQLCSDHDQCVGINFVIGHNHCHLNLGDGTAISGFGSNIHTGNGRGPVDHSAGHATWECYRIVNNI